MTFLELFFIAIALSMDAFAVSICAGLTMPSAIIKRSLIVGLYFGVFQAIMPFIGYMAASLFADYIIEYDHWVAFALLSFLGARMIYGSFKKNEAPTGELSVGPKIMLPLAIATSIDALAVGVSFTFLQVSIMPAILLIGATTFIISVAGVKIGNVFGVKYKSKAELAGGIILILIGVNILIGHLSL